MCVWAHSRHSSFTFCYLFRLSDTQTPNALTYRKKFVVLRACLPHRAQLIKHCAIQQARSAPWKRNNLAGTLAAHKLRMECVAINIIPSNKRNKKKKKTVEEEEKNSHFSFTKYVNNEHLACTGEWYADAWDEHKCTNCMAHSSSCALQTANSKNRLISKLNSTNACARKCMYVFVFMWLRDCLASS